MAFDPAQHLNNLVNLSDSDIDLAKTALALAAVMQPGLLLERYEHHLKKLEDEVAGRFKELLDAGGDNDAETRLAALKHVIADTHEYAGDVENYDDLQNASLIRVIDRGRGMPITLAILYIYAGQAQGWDIRGINFPGHFICRLEHEGRRLIFDPFEQCRILEAPDLRALLKRAGGPHAELSSSFYDPASNREILIRLQNNIKFRQIEMEDYQGALQTVETMLQIDPDEFRLLLDAGVLYARTEQTQAAIDALEDYIKQAPGDRERHQAALLLQELKSSLN